MTKQEICKILNVGRNRGIWEALVELGIIALVEDANGKIVPALRVVVHAEEAECPPPPLPCSILMNGITLGEGGAAIDIEGTLATHVSLHYNFNSGETEDDTTCIENTGSLPFGDGGMFLKTPGVTVFTVNASNDECATVCSSASFTNYCDTVYVPESGDDTVFTPDDLPVCDGEVVFTEFVSLGDLVGVTLDSETGAITVPAQTVGEGAIFGYYMTCDGVLVATVVVNVANVPLGLRMVFNDISQMPLGITDPTDVAEWNTLFDLPTNGTPFASVVVVGNILTLVGGVVTSMPTTKLLQATVLGKSIIEIEDQSSTLEATGTGMLYGNGTVTANLPDTITVGAATFQDNKYLETVILTSATTVLNSAFSGCIAATLIDMPLCVNLGTDPTDNSVFNGITGQTITLNIAAVNATNNGGNEHASIALLRANNTLTCNYV